MKEIWKDVAGYKGLYMVSNMGNVKSLKRIITNKHGIKRVWQERLLKTFTRKKGVDYQTVCLAHKGHNTYFFVHRLVADAFIGKRKGMQINHKDENPLNNRIDNLEWCTPKYNSNYGNHNYNVAKSKFKAVVQYSKDRLPIDDFVSVQDAALAVAKSKRAAANISKCLHGEIKSAYGYIWKFKN